MRTLLALAAALTLALPAAAKEPTDGTRTILVLSRDDQSEETKIARFKTQERCQEYALVYTRRYRQRGEAVYFFCRAEESYS
jgi:hypothetical protein